MGQWLRGLALTLWFAAGDLLALFRRRKPYKILSIHLTGELAEERSEPRWLARMRRGPRDFLSLVSLLRWARDDTHLEAVLITMDGMHCGWAQAQGIRRAIERLRGAGKRVWVHLVRADLREYIIASAADRVSVDPSGTLELAGLSVETMFFADALGKLGVQAEIIQVGQFKSAAEPFTRNSMSPAHREMLEALVDDLYDQASRAVASGRGLELEAAHDLLGSGPFLGSEAVERKLADVVCYSDEAEDQLAGEPRDEVIGEDDYRRRRGRALRREVLRRRHSTIAILHVTGTVKSGESVPGPVSASGAGAATLCAELERLEERGNVAAAVIRIDSPGGSGLASDQIWRAVRRLRSKKPVVISLGDTAASGGYYIAAAGAPIVAEPATITGSIGVIAGKANLRGLYDRIGLTKETVSRGRNAAIYSDYVPLGTAERSRLESHARGFYDDFLGKVAEGRSLTREAVAAVAEGRVWTGQQAQARGLVDLLGGFEEALTEAKALAGLPADSLVALERYPRPPRFWRLPFLSRSGDVRLRGLAPWLEFGWHERIWAVLPFRLRIF